MPEGVYKIKAVGQQLGIGVADSHYLSLIAVGKPNTPNAPYCIPNELICAALARFLCLPVPPSGLVVAPNATTKEWFASLDFNLAGDSLPPVNSERCVKELPALSAGLLLFDILVVNSDRHAENLSVDFSQRPPQMDVFDHSHALFGYTLGKAVERLNFMRTRLGISGGQYTGGNRHCLLDKVVEVDSFHEWIKRIESIPDFYISYICDHAKHHGISSEEAQGARDFLQYRRDHFSAIIEGNKGEFTAVEQWGLFT